MALVFTNFATSTLATAGGINTLVTALDVAPGDGALFPVAPGSTSDYFYITVVDVSGNREIMKVTTRATDTFTVVRGQDGTSARAFAEGDKIELRLNAAALEDHWTNWNKDLNGAEFILDADGDTSITADTDDQIDIKISGTDQFSIIDGAIVPTTDNDIDIGTTTKAIKTAYIKNLGGTADPVTVAYITDFDLDGGSNAAAFPTNGITGAAKIMIGNANTIAWFYVNTAPPGWKVLATGADTVIAVGGGGAGYTGSGGTQYATDTWEIDDLTHGHTHTVATHRHALQQDLAAIGTSKMIAHYQYTEYSGTQTTSGASTGSVNSGATWRCPASVGKLFQLDTA